LLLVLVLLATLLAGLVVRTFVLRPLTVESTSMEPTLCPGDRVFVDLWDPDIGDLTRGDLVALRPDRSEVPVVKRVVGLPGDKVAINDALLYVNGELVDEPYVDHKSIDSVFYGPVVVPTDRFLVLGDARAVSIDSRAYGTVPADRLLGTVALRLRVGNC
jgi:signal peptidase I